MSVWKWCTSLFKKNDSEPTQQPKKGVLEGTFVQPIFNILPTIPELYSPQTTMELYNPNSGTNSNIDHTTGPKSVRMMSDDYHLEHFGETQDGKLVWIGYQHNWNHKTGETIDYIFKFIFDKTGKLVASDIRTIGVRGQYDVDQQRLEFSDLLAADVISTPASVMIQTFSVLHDGIEFGLIVREPEEDEDIWCVEFMPGNTMAFFKPFDSGDYDT